MTLGLVRLFGRLDAEAAAREFGPAIFDDFDLVLKEWMGYSLQLFGLLELCGDEDSWLVTIMPCFARRGVRCRTNWPIRFGAR